MCGVLFSLCLPGNDDSELFARLRSAIRARGPDSEGEASFSAAFGARASIAASVLALRGDESVPQPHRCGRVTLAFNGEIFGGPLSTAQGDTAALGAALNDALDAVAGHNDSQRARANAVLQIAASIVGPFAFLAWDDASGELFAARDAMGRRSLLWSADGGAHGGGPTFASVSSAAAIEGDPSPPSFTELPPEGVYILTSRNESAADKDDSSEMRALWSSHGWSLDMLPWPAAGAASALILRNADQDDEVAETDDLTAPRQAAFASTILASLIKSVELRVSPFTAVAATTRGHHPAVSRASSLQTLFEEDQKLPAFVEPIKEPARIAVLFSGGLDSMLLALLVHMTISASETVDLISVDFASGASADRAAALDGLRELRAIAPSRAWQFIAVNASFEECKRRATLLLALTMPRTTHLDWNLAAALEAGARAVGWAGGSTCGGGEGPDSDARARLMRSAARVILSGLGADELFGGYARHRTAWRLGGVSRVAAELRADASRLWTRNLGRDDRVAASQARELRWPYLDEDFLRATASIPLSARADFTKPPGEGDKMILRDIARSLGLTAASTRVKRAFHFGSGLASQTNKATGMGRKGANEDFSLE